MVVDEGVDRLFTRFTANPDETVRENEYFGPPEASKPVIAGWLQDTGAIVSGRRTFDIAGGWNPTGPDGIAYTFRGKTGTVSTPIGVVGVGQPARVGGVLSRRKEAPLAS